MMAPRIGVTRPDYVSIFVIVLSSGMTCLTVAPELEESSQTGGTLVTQTESTASLATVQRVVHIVLEQPRHAVVGETLAQLDNSHKPGGDGQVFGDMTEVLGLLRSRLLTIGGF